MVYKDPPEDELRVDRSPLTGGEDVRYVALPLVDLAAYGVVDARVVGG